MKEKIKKYFYLIAGFSIGLTIIMATYIYYNIYKSSLFHSIQTEATVLVEGIRRGENIEEMVQHEVSLRVTWIQKDGKVLFDNQADYRTMENHKNRPEVKEAKEDGEGKSVRESDTLDINTYYYAYEDLGSVGDFDFNDVVLGVDYPVMNGTDKTAVIKVYAAGGTLPVSVKYNGTEICADVHTALNVSTSTMVNTGSQMSMDPVTIYTKTGITGTFDASNMDLSIVVKGTNTSTEIVPNVQSGQVPQMIKVPSPWRWPREQVNISAAYVSFGAWGCNYTANKTWYQNGDSSKTTAPK